jgi:hypothetical protein
LDEALVAAVTSGGPDAALQVCRACVDHLGMSGASVTIMAGPDRQQPVCATDDAAARIDELQFALGDGPCVQAYSTGRAVLVADVVDPTDTRWPVFSASAAETGARGMFVFPLQVGGTRLGVLDCFRNVPGLLDPDELAGGLRAADAAVWALLEHEEGHARTHDPETAMISGQDWFDGSTLARAEVHQATGMVIVQAGVPAPVALSRIRGLAFASGRSIADIARDIISRRLRLDHHGSQHGGTTDTGIEDGPP